MNEKELPHGCALAIEVFCVCLTLGVSFRFVWFRRVVVAG